MLKTHSLYCTIDFFKPFKIYGLDCGCILSNDVVYKFLARVIKNGILFTNNMSKYSATFLFMFLMLAGVF